MLPVDQPYWSHVRHTAAGVAESFAYARIETPVFEDTGLFLRGVGLDTDVVQKEMYTFQDHGGDSLTLRPEGTAPVCRAYLEHGMRNLPQPVRLYYFGTMFRYERPQAGRFRQHQQFGVEAIGDPSPQVDTEVILLGWTYLQSLGIGGATVKVNSIGDPQCRPGYLDRLRAYYERHVQVMCGDCRARLARSPLRLLDCKKSSCQQYAARAPRSIDHLCAACQDHWVELLTYLEDARDAVAGLRFDVDHRLVRGLDYYTRTVFEVHPEAEGAQSAMLSGGRYDGLIEQLGGPPTPGTGFGSGIERIILNLKRQETPVPRGTPLEVAIVQTGEAARRKTMTLAAELRALGHSVLTAPPGRSVKAQMRFANAMSARYVLVLGDREIERDIAGLKPLDGGDQVDVPLGAAAISASMGKP